MRALLRSSRVHLLLWGLMALYLIVAPIAYDHFFVSGAKPTAVDTQLPPWTPMAKAGVDAFELNDAQEGIYQIVGWGFPTVDTKVAAGDYVRQVVLISGNHNYVFEAKTGKRKDIRDYFKSLGMDVQMSGFLAYMNQHSVDKGLYSVGLIFSRTGSDEAYYMTTGRCIARTPNRLILEDPAKHPCPVLTAEDMGTPIQVDRELPPRLEESQAGVDALTLYDEPSGVHQLVGWAFSTADKGIPAGAYERRVALISSTRNYVFSAATIARPDVQDFFPSLGMDLGMSGFTAFIDAKALEPGVYAIGVILKGGDGGQEYLIDKGWCLRARPGKLKLMDLGSPACQSIYQPDALP